jgi:threonine efflux protein
MADWTAVVATVTIYAAGVVIPGPNFVSVTHRAMAQGRRDRLSQSHPGDVRHPRRGHRPAVASGHGARPEMAWLGLPVMAYLPYRNSSVKPVAKQVEHERNLYLGDVFINLSNPESMVYYTSVFSSAVMAQPSLPTLLAVLATVGFIGCLWYGTIGLILSAETVAARYRLVAHMNICVSLCIVDMCMRNLV